MLGLHPWACGYPAAAARSPASPAAALPRHSIFRDPRGVSVSRFSSVPPTCCRMRGCRLPSFRCPGCCSYRQVRGRATLCEPEPPFGSTSRLACTVLITLIVNMELVTRYLVLNQIAIFIAFQERAIGREDKAENVSTLSLCVGNP